MRVAVVGAGSIAREFATTHLGAATSTRVACIVDVDVGKAGTLARDVGSIQAGARVVGTSGYRAGADVQRGPPVPHCAELTDAVLDACDCVYVGTTPSSHAALALRALRAGKHLLLEKPLAASAADADAIVEASERALSERGLVTSLNIGMRWNGALLRMREELAAGRIGALRGGSLSLHFRRWPRDWQQQPWVAARAEGGPLREVGTHFLFALQELLGHGCVGRVRADVRYPDGPAGTQAEESVAGLLEAAPRGAQGPVSFQLSVKTREGGGRDLCELCVHGSEGSLRLFDFTSLEGPAGQLLVDGADYGRREFVDGLVAASGRGPPPAEPAVHAPAGTVSAREARSAQRVVDAVLSSGGEWVDVAYG